MHNDLRLLLRSSLIIFAMPLFGVACVETRHDPGSMSRVAVDDPTDEFENQPGVFSGGENNTHSHMGDLGAGAGKNPFDILAQRQEEGPPEVRTRLHSCQKLQNEAIGNLLESLGVNLDAMGIPPTAGQLLKGGTGALGGASFDARVGESIVWTTAGAVKLFDIFVQAAPEIIANLPAVAQCRLNGVSPAMFDAQNRCNASAISCISGRPATSKHIDACNAIVRSASDTDKGKRIAVATLMAAAHSCE